MNKYIALVLLTFTATPSNLVSADSLALSNGEIDQLRDLLKGANSIFLDENLKSRWERDVKNPNNLPQLRIDTAKETKKLVNCLLTAKIKSLSFSLPCSDDIKTALANRKKAYDAMERADIVQKAVPFCQNSENEFENYIKLTETMLDTGFQVRKGNDIICEIIQHLSTRPADLKPLENLLLQAFLCLPIKDQEHFTRLQESLQNK